MEAALQTVDGGDLAATPAAYEAAAEIRATIATVTAMAQTLEAVVMERLWIIRGEIPDEAGFDAFVERHTPIEAPQARTMVETWRVARKRRDLRELAQRQPDDALSLVSASVEAGVRIEDATDEQVAGILARPPRMRHRAIRQLIKSADGETPAARERIRTLEAERDDALARAVRGSAPSDRIRSLVVSMERAERELAGLAMDANLALSAGAPAAAADRLVALGDQIVDAVNRITELVEEEEDA